METDIEPKPLYYEQLAIPNSDEITEFQKKVYGATRLIPFGSVTTYGTIAKLINCRSSQAVGQALKRNPWPIDLKDVDSELMVPCHRIVARNGEIGGFSGQRNGKQIKRKVKLLNHEGVRFVLNIKTNKYSLDQQMRHKLIKKFRKVILKTKK